MISFLYRPYPVQSHGLLTTHDVDAGSVAISSDGTLLADVDKFAHCVRIYSLSDDGETVVGLVGIFGKVGVPGDDASHLHFPSRVCFVSTKSLLITDSFNNRVVETTSSGEFMRAIRMPPASFPCGVSFCQISDVIGVTLYASDEVLVVRYTTLVPVWTLAAHSMRRPIAIVLDGRSAIVASGNYINTFCMATGECLSSVEAPLSLRDIVLTKEGEVFSVCGRVDNYLFQNGLTIMPRLAPCETRMECMAYSSKTHRLVMLKEDPWFFENNARRAWLSACCM